MKHRLIFSGIITSALFSCTHQIDSTISKTVPSEGKSEQKYENKAHELVYKMVQNVGNYKQLQSLNNVVYTYNYQTPDGKNDISQEKYIFKEELSYGAYSKHERTLPELKGKIEQGYDGEGYWLKNQGQLITDTNQLKKVIFNRHTNYYWFTMMQKLLDPGLNYELIDEKTINGNEYHVVKITFDSQDDKPTDTYQLYINKKTNLVDQFLFTVADFGKMDPSLMQLEYEKVDGIMIPTKRKYKSSDWNAIVTDEPWTTVNWTDISFNNKLDKKDFQK